MVTEKKTNKRVKKNVSILVNILGKKSIDLLVEYCELVKKNKEKTDSSKFDGKQINDMTIEEIQDYLMIAEQKQVEFKKNEILNRIKTYGITIDIEQNIKKQKEDIALKQQRKINKN